jgi:transposase
MFAFPPTVRVFYCGQTVDLRKSFDGLAGCVQQILQADPLSGHLFVFFNRRRTLVKVLMWDRSGYCLFCKRLERGRFVLDDADTVNAQSVARLQLVLEGIDLRGARQRTRFALT